MSQEDTD